MKPWLDVDGVTVFHGDCRDVMYVLPDASVDAVVTDPPYELAFMSKHWDTTGVAYDPLVWAEALRVLKPGGHLLAFGGTRTWHRLAVAIEDAGFEVRDNVAYLHDGGLPGPMCWAYGSGFPKSLDVSKAIDKRAGAEREVVGVGQYANRGRVASGSQVDVGDSAATVITAPATPAAEQWQGWGTALKPAHEPIVVARKPLIGTVAENVLTHGTGALNIDGCRIGTDETLGRAKGGWGNAAVGADNYGNFNSIGVTKEGGRWPANVILDESQAAELDKQSGVSVAKPERIGKRGGNGFGFFDDDKSASANGRWPEDLGGGASRFFYVAKAGKKERPNVNGIAHPTVKPMALMRYLVRLVTPPGGTVLEPFAGSGTTIEACVIEGFNCIAIEREADYLPLIEARLNRPIQAAL